MRVPQHNIVEISRDLLTLYAHMLVVKNSMISDAFLTVADLSLN